MGTTLILGAVLGLFGSMPIAGPLAAVTIKLGLDRRFSVARTMTLGAGVAEGGYAYLAYWGVTGIVGTAPWLADLAHAIAAALLMAFGIYFYRRGARVGARDSDDEPRRGGERRGFLLGLTIGGSNPALLASWSAAVAFIKSSGLADLQQRHALLFGVGATLGVIAWFWSMIAIAERYRDRMVTERLDRMVRRMGAVLTVLGLALAARALFELL